MTHTHTKSGEEMARECDETVAQLRALQTALRSLPGNKVWRALKKCDDYWLSKAAVDTGVAFGAVGRELESLCIDLADRAKSLRYKGPGGPGEEKA
jgi:hypothetical protein